MIFAEFGEHGASNELRRGGMPGRLLLTPKMWNGTNWSLEYLMPLVSQLD